MVLRNNIVDLRTTGLRNVLFPTVFKKVIIFLEKLRF